MKPNELERIAQAGLEAARVLLWSAAILAFAMALALLLSCDDASEPDTCAAWLDCYERCRLDLGGDVSQSASNPCGCGDAQLGHRRIVVMRCVACDAELFGRVPAAGKVVRAASDVSRAAELLPATGRAASNAARHMASRGTDSPLW